MEVFVISMSVIFVINLITSTVEMFGEDTLKGVLGFFANGFLLIWAINIL